MGYGEVSRFLKVTARNRTITFENREKKGSEIPVMFAPNVTSFSEPKK
jgi:hypothetical protein